VRPAESLESHQARRRLVDLADCRRHGATQRNEPRQVRRRREPVGQKDRIDLAVQQAHRLGGRVGPRGQEKEPALRAEQHMAAARAEEKRLGPPQFDRCAALHLGHVAMERDEEANKTVLLDVDPVAARPARQQRHRAEQNGVRDQVPGRRRRRIDGARARLPQPHALERRVGTVGREDVEAAERQAARHGLESSPAGSNDIRLDNRAVAPFPPNSQP
jgi:hypothetical protein